MSSACGPVPFAKGRPVLSRPLFGGLHPTLPQLARNELQKPGPAFVTPSNGQSCSFSFIPFQPVPHPASGGFKVACRNCLTFVADAVDCHNATALHKKPKHPSVQLANMPQFKQPMPQRL